MAIVTDSLLAGLRTGFNAAFKRGANHAPSNWQQVATKIPSTNASNTYGWLGQFPKLSEWIGTRTIKSMKEYGYVITNKKYESTVGVARTDIEDDNLGIYATLFEEMGYAAGKHPDELVFALLGQGFATNCYDGKPFFAAEHPVAVNVDGTGGYAKVSNVLDAATSPEKKTPWFLLDTSRPLKPLIFQERTTPELQAITDVKNDNVFLKDEYLYGVRYRCNAGFGFWQQAVGVRDDLTAANFEKALGMLQSFQADGGRPLGLGMGGKAGTLLVVPPSLYAAARKLIAVELVNGGESNPWYDAATIVNVPWLTPGVVAAEGTDDTASTDDTETS